MCGVGGDLLAMVWSDGELVGLNSSGRLPVEARMEAEGVPERGVAAATVPGAPAGWGALAERFGTRSLDELAAPAIRLSREGVDRPPGLARATESHAWLLERDTEAKRIFLASGSLVQEELAETLEDLGNFYTGITARAAPAPFAPDDFAAHRAEWVEPWSEDFAGVTVLEMPPNSRGRLALEALRKLEPLDGLAPSDAEWHLRLIRACRGAGMASDTVYICVMDQNHMAVSLNQSLYMAFGSGVVIPGTGVLLQNRGAYLRPEEYRGAAKPIHTLSPAMALADGRPRLVFGTMGGDAQVQIHVQLLARLLLTTDDPQDAVAAPRWVLRDGTLLVENGLPDLRGLVGGITVRPMPEPAHAGHAHAIRVDHDGLRAGCDPRADGIPVGF
jgi:gamma-glutamyltranspeptidase/glutathione hydrolase